LCLHDERGGSKVVRLAAREQCDDGMVGAFICDIGVSMPRNA